MTTVSTSQSRGAHSDPIPVRSLLIVASLLAVLMPALWVKDVACQRDLVGYPICLPASGAASR